jgi:hypothetical protein
MTCGFEPQPPRSVSTDKISEFWIIEERDSRTVLLPGQSHQQVEKVRVGRHIELSHDIREIQEWKWRYIRGWCICTCRTKQGIKTVALWGIRSYHWIFDAIDKVSQKPMLLYPSFTVLQLPTVMSYKPSTKPVTNPIPISSHQHMTS